MSGPAPARTGIVLLLDELAPDLAAARYELDPPALQRVPLHITLLFPWLPLAQLTGDDVERLRAFFAARPRPEFDLTRFEVFEEAVTYAAPEPAGPLLALIRDVAAAYPEHPPYEGEFALEAIVPHATLAPLPGVGVDEVRRRVEGLLPVRCEPARASLIEEHEPNRFREREPLPFGAAA